MTTAVKDYIIIGAGPGGLQLAYFMKKNNQDFLILERSDHAGAFFSKFPRSRNLISFNKRNNIYKDPATQMKWDWNSLISEEFSPMMKEFSKKIFPTADELVTYLNHFASAHEIDIRYNTNAVRVSKTENGFKVYDQNGVTYECRMLIVAAGFTKEYTPPTIEGAELLEDSYGTISMNQDEYEDKTVMIIGKGNSAFEVATMMLNTSSLIHLASPRSISLAWDTKYNGSVRAINTHLLDSYQLKLLHSMLDCNVDRIQKREDGKYIVSITYAHACGEKEDLVYDKVIMSAGFQFNDQIFDEDCRPELFNDKLPRINSCWESTNVPNLFFAGTLMQYLDFRRSSSAFIGGFRHNVSSLYNILEWKLKNVELPKKVLPIDVDVLTDHILTRLHKSAGLWHLFGHMCDILIVNKEDNSCTYLNELPLLFVQEHLSDKDLLFTINYQFGDTTKNNFSLDRFPDNRQSEKSTFLHPVVNKVVNGKIVSTHHILEDLLGNYHPETASEVSLNIRSKTKKQFHEDEHVAPLKEFLRTQTV